MKIFGKESSFYDITTFTENRSSDYGTIKYSDVIHRTLYKSTLHGYPFSVKEKGWFKRCVWLCISVTFTIVLLVHFALLTKLYREYNVNVNRELSHSRELEFPAITICNTNPVKRSKLYLVPELEALTTSWSASKRKRKKRSLPWAGGGCVEPDDCGTAVGDGDYHSCVWNGYADGCRFYITCSGTNADDAIECPWPQQWDDLSDSCVVDSSTCENGVVTTTACTTGYNPATSSCYWLIDDQSVSATTAATNCGNDGGQLATVKTAATKTFLDDAGMFSSGHSFWIGLSHDGGTTSANTHFDWSDGTAMDSSWTDWYASYNYDQHRPCVMYNGDPAWQDASCLEGRNYLCEYVYATATAVTAAVTTTTDSTTTITSTVTTPDPASTTTATTTTTTDPVITDSGTATVEASEESYIMDYDDTSTAEATTDRTTNDPGDPYFDYQRDGLREDFLRENDVITILANTPSDIQRQLGYTQSEFVLECTFKGKECNDNDFGYYFDPNHGSCFVFNSGWNWNSSQNHYLTTNSGPSQALAVVLNLKQSEYVGNIGTSAGAIVVVHPHDKMPFPEDEGTFASPGHLTSVSMRKVLESKLGAKFKQCDDQTGTYPDIFKEYLPVDYSINSCYKTCYQIHVIETCRCADPQYPMRGTALGGFTGWACNHRNRTEDLCMLGVTQLFATGDIDCNCPNKCIEETYELLTSKSLWPEDSAYNSIIDKYSLYGDNATQQFVADNLVKIEVYYNDLNILINEQLPAYTGMEYLADVYNMAIIWVGTTIFSLAEVLIMLIDLLIITIYRSKTLSQLKKNDSKVEHSDDELDDNESNEYPIASYANLTANIGVSDSNLSGNPFNDKSRGKREPNDSGVHLPEVEHKEDIELENENHFHTKDNGAPPFIHDFYSQSLVNDDVGGGTKLTKRNKSSSYKKSKVSDFSSTDKDHDEVSSNANSESKSKSSHLSSIDKDSNEVSSNANSETKSIPKKNVQKFRKALLKLNVSKDPYGFGKGGKGFNIHPKK